jgi:fructokinase
MIRIGVDFGGTKIEAAALDGSGRFLARIRRPNPRAYDAALQVVRELVEAAESEAGARPGPIGVAIPGSLSPRTGFIRNANSTWLNDQSFREDLEAELGRPVRLANDANCLALSEATDGAGAGKAVVFALILGTGCGSGVVVDGKLIEGRNGVAGEIGHSPLPWPTPEEVPAPDCWCGLKGCLETYISGSGLQRDYAASTRRQLSAEQIVEAARRGEPAAAEAMDLLGGGMSNVEELYARTPQAIAPYVFSDVFDTPVVRAAHGDSSGVRGAAWLWPVEALA